MEPISGAAKVKPCSRGVRRYLYFALARRICRGSHSSRGHRCWGDSSAVFPSTIMILVSLLLNAAIYCGIGLVLGFFGEVFSSFSKALGKVGLSSQPQL